MNQSVQAANTVEKPTSTMYSKLIAVNKRIDPKLFVASDKNTLNQYFDKVFLRNNTTEDICNAIAAISGTDPVSKPKASTCVYVIDSDIIMHEDHHYWLTTCLYGGLIDCSHSHPLRLHLG